MTVYKANVICALVALLMFGCAAEHHSNRSDANTSQQTSIIPDSVPLPYNWPWRGITIVSHGDREMITKAKIHDLKEQGVNYVRLMVSIRKHIIKEQVDVRTGILQSIDWSQKVIKWCADENIAVQITQHEFPVDPSKGYNQTSSQFWNSPQDLQQALQLITKIVVSFDSFPNVVSYEFLPEPIIKENRSIPPGLRTFSQQIIDTVRRYSDKFLVFSPGKWGDPSGFTEDYLPFADDKIIYNFQFYTPHEYTHQGIGHNKQHYTYPGRVGLIRWDKEALEKKILQAINWSVNNGGKPITTGEFSVVRWADGKEQYLGDVLSLLEKHNVSYAYFCLNGWEGWRLENEPKPRSKPPVLQPANSKTKSHQILEKYWQKNSGK